MGDIYAICISFQPSGLTAGRTDKELQITTIADSCGCRPAKLIRPHLQMAT